MEFGKVKDMQEHNILELAGKLYENGERDQGV